MRVVKLKHPYRSIRNGVWPVGEHADIPDTETLPSSAIVYEGKAAEAALYRIAGRGGKIPKEPEPELDLDLEEEDEEEEEKPSEPSTLSEIQAKEKTPTAAQKREAEKKAAGKKEGI